MKRQILFFIFLFFSFSECSYGEKLNLYVSILPQKFFAEKICGNKADVNVLVSKGFSPETFNPSPGQITGLGHADILFLIGVPFEKRWSPKIRNNFPALEIKDSSMGIEKRNMDDSFTHDEKGDDKDHGMRHYHEFYDPHIWMSPLNVLRISRNMLNGIVKKDPVNSEFYKKNYESFAGSIIKLDLEIKELLKRANGKSILVFHPSFGYFMDDYNLVQIPVEYNGKSPSPSYLSKLMKISSKRRIKVMLIQPQFPSSAVTLMKKNLGLELLTADPLAYEWDKNLKHITKEISAKF